MMLLLLELCCSRRSPPRADCKAGKSSFVPSYIMAVAVVGSDRAPASPLPGRGPEGVIAFESRLRRDQPAQGLEGGGCLRLGRCRPLEAARRQQVAPPRLLRGPALILGAAGGRYAQPEHQEVRGHRMGVAYPSRRGWGGHSAPPSRSECAPPAMLCDCTESQFPACPLGLRSREPDRCARSSN